MERNNSQKDAVLRFMERNGWLTQRIASDQLGVDRLPARISEIKDILADPKKLKEYNWQKYEGRYIVTEYDNVTNRYGHRARIARYNLNE